MRERRRRLLDAGLAAFGTQGFHATRVRDVCNEAGLTERYFYESFANREALFLAVYNECVATLRAATEAALGRLDPTAVTSPAVLLETFARAGLHAFFSTLADEPRMARILFIDVLTINPDVGAQSRVAVEGFAQLVADLAGAMFPDLVRRGLDPRLMGTGLVGATVFLAVRWTTEDFPEPVDVMVEHALAFFTGVGTTATSD